MLDTLDGWRDRSVGAVREDGLGGIAEAVRTLPSACATALLQSLGTVYTPGDPVSVLDREWDVLVVLDACRADTMAAVADEYDFLADRGPATSPASQSRPWLEATFGEQCADRVAYVTANPHTDATPLPAVDHLDEVWRSGWDDDLGTVPAEAVTDRAVAVGREATWDRLVVHYMQPHAPYVPAPIGATTDLDTWGEGLPRSDPFYRLNCGDVGRSRMRAAYRKTLRYVLDNVATLVRNVAGDRGIVTADHGESFGEFGVYGHPPSVPTPQLRRVPWYETSLTDTGDHEPTTDDASAVAVDTEERLRALGYR